MMKRYHNPLMTPEEMHDMLKKEAEIRGIKNEGSPHPEPERKSGVKLDGNKNPVWRGVIQYFPNALDAVARVSLEGAQAPGHLWGGWKDVPDGYRRYSDAMMRHILEEADIVPVEGPDSSVQLEHVQKARIAMAAVVAWNAMARLEHLIADSME